MKRIHLLLPLALLLLPAATLAKPAAYWVELADKGASETLTSEELHAAAMKAGLTGAALDRRRIEGIPEAALITLADLPVAPEYLAELERMGATLEQTSRWFNLVSIEAEPEAVERISELDFVLSVSSMGYLMPTHSEYEIVGEFDGNPAPGPGMDAAGIYGPSYLQALQINVVEAHRQGYTGRGVILAIIDGGFTLDHEAYERIDVIGSYDVTNNEVSVKQEENDAPGQTGHGTLCLSTIAGYSPGNLIGTAYEASFLLVKSEYVPTETIQEEDDYVAGLEWAERNGAMVTSSSLGYTDWYNDAMKDGEIPITSRALRRASEMGILVVTSAGNEGPQPRTLGPPADHYGGLTIGAVDSLGSIAGFSSRGPTADGRIKPDLVARGVKCVCIRSLTHHTYALVNGTSLSTPVMAGAAAVLRSAHPDWSAKQCIRALKSTADNAAKPDNTYGWGIPDVMAAIRFPELRLIAESESGEGVEGLTFVATGPDGVEVQAVSDGQGVASLPNLPEGKWNWSLQLPEDRELLSGQLSGTAGVNESRTVRIMLADVDGVE